MNDYKVVTTLAILFIGAWITMKSWERAATHPEKEEKIVNTIYLVLAILVDGFALGIVVSGELFR